MSEETAERLNDGDSFAARVLTALAAISGQLGSMSVRQPALEKKVDAYVWTGSGLKLLKFVEKSEGC